MKVRLSVPEKGPSVLLKEEEEKGETRCLQAIVLIILHSYFPFCFHQMETVPSLLLFTPSSTLCRCEKLSFLVLSSCPHLCNLVLLKC